MQDGLFQTVAMENRDISCRFQHHRRTLAMSSTLAPRSFSNRLSRLTLVARNASSRTLPSRMSRTGWFWITRLAQREELRSFAVTHCTRNNEAMAATAWR